MIFYARLYSATGNFKETNIQAYLSAKTEKKDCLECLFPYTSCLGEAVYPRYTGTCRRSLTPEQRCFLMVDRSGEESQPLDNEQQILSFRQNHLALSLIVAFFINENAFTKNNRYAS